MLTQVYRSVRTKVHKNNELNTQTVIKDKKQLILSNPNSIWLAVGNIQPGSICVKKSNNQNLCFYSKSEVMLKICLFFLFVQY